MNLLRLRLVRAQIVGRWTIAASHSSARSRSYRATPARRPSMISRKLCN
jgi:hypothetical protein